MFNLTDFNANSYNGSDGLFASFMTGLLSRLNKLVHSPETGVILLDGNGTIAHKGNIVCLKLSGGPYEYYLAFADGVQGSNPLGVAIALGEIPDGGKGYFRFSGEADVLLEDNLNVKVGDQIYVSSELAGRGINKAPSDNGFYIRLMGVVVDATKYGTTGLVTILIDKCCPKLIES